MFDERYLKKEYTCIYHFDFFHANRHGNKETNRKLFDVKCDNSQGMQKMIKKWEEPSFLKTLLLAFTNFMIINIERFAGINFVIAAIFTFSFILHIVNILVLLF